MTALPQGEATSQPADIAAENERLRTELAAALARQTATADILKVIASSPSDVQPVFEVIVERAVQLCGGRMGRVYRYDDGIIHMVAGQGLSAPGLSKVQEVFPRPAADDTTAGLVIRSRQANFVTDIETDSVPALSRQMIEALGTRSQVTVPMLRNGEPIGAITVGWAEPGAYGDQQVALLQTFANQAVIAIENVRLFNETREALERQTATAEVLRVIASSPTDVKPVLDAIVESACKLCEASDAYVALKDGDDLVFQTHHGSIPVAWKRRPINRRWPAGRAVADGKFVHLRDVLAPEGDEFPDGREIARRDGARSVLTVPLMREGGSIGVIILRRTEVLPFTDKQIDLLRTFADQAVIAIENVRLFNETREALERQTATADILKVIASSPSDVQPVFEAIATSANKLLDGFSTTVFRFIDGALHLMAFTPTNAAADEALQALFPAPVATFPVLELVRDGKIAQLADTEDASTGERLQAIARARGFRSLLFTPLMSKGALIGTIGVTRREPSSFAAHHVQLLQTFADQAVIAIENVRLFDEVQAKTRDLSEALEQQTATADVLKVISRSPEDLKPVFAAMLENATRICAAKFGVMFRFGDGAFHVDSLLGVPPAFAENLLRGPRRPAPGTALGRLSVSKEIVHITDMRAEPAYIEGDPLRRATTDLGGARTFLAVPMLKDNELVGALAIYRQEVRPFSEKQIELVTSFASQAVIAIENVRLVNELQARTRELSTSLDELRTAQDRLVQTEKLASLGQLTAGIAHEIKNPLNFVNNFSSLSAELVDELNDVLKPVALNDTIRQEIDELTGLLKDNLQKVVQHGKRADSIVKNMLLHSREGSGEHRPTDINSLLDESLNLAYHGARAEKREFNITLQRNFDATAGTIEVFPQEITRVFLNLISNGFYAVNKRKIENGNPDFESVLSATTRNLGNNVEVRIRDNGTGIPAEVKEKMFNPFFTTKPAGEGTGLGLSMSHDIIVKQHGGTIDVETEPGEFTEFRIVLPRTSEAQQRNQDKK